jgi:hypothetical protein
MANENAKKIYAIVARVDAGDKQRFFSLAASEEIPPACVLRKLIKSVLKGELLLNDIFKENGYEILKEQNERKIVGKRTEIKTRLTEEEKRDFFALSQKWDFMPGTLARILVKFYVSANSEAQRVQQKAS